MGFFDWFSGPRATGKKVSFADKSKLTRQDIVDLVWNIKTLDTRQKELVKQELIKELDDGGVSLFEYKEFLRKLKLRRVELGLSQVDVDGLEEIIKK